MTRIFAYSLESIADRAARLGRANGFDGLRLALALGIVAFHSVTLTEGGPGNLCVYARAAAQMILPAFFALSGYLVAASLARCGTVREFLALRLLRIVPALGLVIAASALVLGPLVSALPPGDYFRDPLLAAYFRNVVAQPHFLLPGVFEANPRAGIVNGSLWTIQLELTCYFLLAALALLLRGRALSVALAVAALLLLFPLLPFAGLLLAWLPAKALPLAFCTGALLFRLARHVPLHAAPGAASLGIAFFCLMQDGISSAWSAPLLAYGAIWLATRRIPAALTRNDYSYGLYLAAYPLQQACIALFPHAAWWTILLLVLPPALLCALALWHGVEKPLLSRKHELVARLDARRLVRA